MGEAECVAGMKGKSTTTAEAGGPPGAGGQGEVLSQKTTKTTISISWSCLAAETPGLGSNKDWKTRLKLEV